MSKRLRALAGLSGTALFILSWIVAGAVREGYDPVEDALSRLAEQGAPNRWIVTVGMIAFGAGAVVFAPNLRGRAALALTVTGVAQFGVALFPCVEGCPRTGSFTALAHAFFAGIIYVTLTATPVLHSRSRYAIVTAIVAAVTLGLHVVGVSSGLFQRIGITTLDVWIIVVALGQLKVLRKRPIDV